MTAITIRVNQIVCVVDRTSAMLVARQFALEETRKIVWLVRDQAIVYCPVKTGNLRRRHRVVITSSAMDTKASVVNDAEYSAAVHDGSKPHIIRARSGFLRFEVDGRTVYARSVRHPGTTANPWLRRAAESVAQRQGWRFTRTVVS